MESIGAVGFSRFRPPTFVTFSIGTTVQKKHTVLDLGLALEYLGLVVIQITMCSVVGRYAESEVLYVVYYV